MIFFPRSFGRGPPGPDVPVTLGIVAHKVLFCHAMLDTHDPYRPALIDWPVLDDETREKIISLPIWDIAVATEGRASMNVKTYGEGITDPLLRDAIDMNAFEEGRHKTVLGDMVQSYGIE